MKKIIYCTLSCIVLIGCHQKNAAAEARADTDAEKTTAPALGSSLNCFTDSKAILNQINQKSTITQLEAANSALKKCTPKLENTQLYQLLDSANNMYQRFLTTTSGEESMEGINAYGYAKEYPDSATDLGHGDAASIKKTLPQRDQYLVDQVGKQYIQFLDVGEGYFLLKQNPQYAVDLFAPYLPRAEAVFIQRMAKDNTDILYSDAAIAISWQQLVERALFWENYIQQYPNSRFVEDAKYLLQEYEYLSFIGSDNSNAFGFSEGRYMVETEEVKPALTWLAKQPNSQVAKKAQLFLDYTSKYYPSIQDNDYDQQYKPIVRLLQLTVPDFKRDCHHTALCIDFE